jgi:AraC-like DNA-binding protein
VLSLTLPAFRITRKELYHFIPVALFMIHAIVVYVRIAGVADLALKDTLAEQLHFNLVKRTEDHLVILSSCIYWYVSYRKILHYRQWLYTHVSASDYPEYVWLRNILILTAILFTALAINMLLDYGFGFGKVYFLHWQLFFLYMSGLIYFLGFKGYHQPTYVLAAPASIYTPALAPETERGVNHSLKEGIEKALTEEKLYLDPDLSLASLAAHLGTGPAVLSATINTLYEKNFRNLINEYRVEAVKKKLTDPACSHLSILGIALECGFNSEASFYRTFKKYTSLSPKEYIEGQNTIT